MKNFLVLVTFLAIASASLFAGGQSDKPTAASKASEGPVPFTFAIVADVPPRADAPVLAALEKKYNFKLQYVNIERSQYNQMLGLKITSGETPNAFMLDGNMLQYAQFVEQGTLRSIPLDMLKKYAPTIYKMQEPYFKYLMIDGEVFGLTGEKATNDYPLNAIWRMDWLERVGISKVPETLAEAEKAFYAFRNGDPDGNGKKDTYALGKSGLDMIFGAFGAIPWGPWPQYSLWIKDGKGGIQHASVMPQMKDALGLLQKWYKDGLIDPEYVLGENKGGYWAIPTDFFTGKIGFTGLGHYYHWVPDTLFPSYAGGPVFSEFKKLNPAARIAFGKAVTGPQGKAGTWLYPVGVGAAGMIVFGAETTDVQLIKLLQLHEGLCSSYEDYLLAAYGFEGTHWYRDEASKAVLRKGDFNQRTKYLEEGIFILSTLQPLEFQKRDAPLLFEFAEKNYRFPGYRTELLVSPPSEKTVRADLEKLRDQYYTEIISGVKPVSAFDEFVKSWNAMGGVKLKQETDAWYKSLK